MRILMISALSLVFLLSTSTQRKAQSPCLKHLHNGGYSNGYAALLNSSRDSYRLTRECRHEANKEIDEALDRLVKAGRLTYPHPRMESHLVAQHRWFNAVLEGTGASNSNSGPDDRQEGLYVFYQPLFDQAVRSWFTNVTVAADSNILHAPDVTFDASVIGCTARIAGFDGGLNTHPVTVIQMIDAHTLVLSERAKEAVKGYSAMLTPPDYDLDLCNCHRQP